MLDDHFHIGNIAMYREINSQFAILNERLNEMGILYNNLKNILIPNIKKQDICYIFDSLLAENKTFYGLEIFNAIIPEILSIENVAVFYGDITGSDSVECQRQIKTELINLVNSQVDKSFRHSTQYFAVYLNNLTKSQAAKIDESMKKLACYIGSVDLSYSCYLKDVIACSIGQKFIKTGKIILLPTPYDDQNNPNGYCPIDFNKYQVKVFGIDEILFGSFLCYKIERSYNIYDHKDQLFSLNAVCESPEIISTFNILIEDEKFNYLLTKKQGSMESTGLGSITKNEFINLIRTKINTNYLFNINYSENFNCLKFATIIEIKVKEKSKRYIAVFEVLNENKTIRLISMY